MKVVMVGSITGTRNGKEWPAPGGEVDLPEPEAQRLIDQGMAARPGDEAAARKRMAAGGWAQSRERAQ